MKHEDIKNILFKIELSRRNFLRRNQEITVDMKKKYLPH